MYNNSFFKKFLIVTVVVLCYSCDKDFNSIGESIIGDNNHFLFDKYTSEVVAYNQKLGPVQSNNLAVNALGIYDDPAFGTTTANFATQLTLETVNPIINISLNPQVESVVLTIPYFSTVTATDVNGNNTYKLDSIYGPADAKIKLSVYRSGYFMRDLDPTTGFLEAQKFYSNQIADFENYKVGAPLNNSPDVNQNNSFFFNPAEYRVTTTTNDVESTVRTAPGMRLDLRKDEFQTLLIASSYGMLANQDVFKNYFRGLYFKVEKSGASPSAMAMMDFKSGIITVNYKEDTSETDATRVDKSLVLKLTGDVARGLNCNTVSLLGNSNENVAYINATNNVNRVSGDDKLYLKGGDGSMAIINLFSSGDLETVRSNGWLINEANLVFHIDATAKLNSYEPQRIYLYDLTNSRPVVDYGFDLTSAASTKNAKLIFNGFLKKEAVANGRGQTYKIRITNQIRNLIKNPDSTNVQLGLVITEDINTSSNSKLLSNINHTVGTTTTTISNIPKAAVMSPLGTILFGSTAAVANDKRLKLEIYYTKPN